MLDSMDYRILSILKENARESASNIGKEVHLSVSAVLDRIRKMEEANVIQKYTIVLNNNKTGNETNALMEVSMDNPKFFDGFTKAVVDHKNIVDCYLLTGDFDFVLKICCQSAEELEQIHKFIMSIEGVSNTRTHYILRSVKNVYSVVPE